MGLRGQKKRVDGSLQIKLSAFDLTLVDFLRAHTNENQAALVRQALRFYAAHLEGFPLEEFLLHVRDNAINRTVLNSPKHERLEAELLRFVDDSAPSNKEIVKHTSSEEEFKQLDQEHPWRTAPHPRAIQFI